MPAASRKQRVAMSIAEHHPEKLYKRNRSLLNMKKSDLHDFASTPEKGLPEKAPEHLPKGYDKVYRKHKK